MARPRRQDAERLPAELLKTIYALETVHELPADLRKVKIARDLAVAFVDQLHDSMSELRRHPYLSREEKEVRAAELQDIANRKVDEVLADIRQTIGSLRTRVDGLLATVDVPDAARTRVQRLIDRDVTPGLILERAIARSDVGMIAAVREELGWLRDQTNNPFRAFVDEDERALQETLVSAEAALIEKTFGADAPAIARAARIGDGMLDASEQFVVRGVHRADLDAPDGVLGSSRLALAYASSDLERAVGDEGSGGG